MTTLRKVQFPSALPALFASARIAAPLALVGALLAEWLATGQGLGYLMLTSSPPGRLRHDVGLGGRASRWPRWCSTASSAASRPWCWPATRPARPARSSDRDCRARPARACPRPTCTSTSRAACGPTTLAELAERYGMPMPADPRLRQLHRLRRHVPGRLRRAAHRRRPGPAGRRGDRRRAPTPEPSGSSWPSTRRTTASASAPTSTSSSSCSTRWPTASAAHRRRAPA